MWSNLYAYYVIRGDKNYEAFRPTEEIAQILKNTGVLERIQLMKFKNLDFFPRLSISIALTADGSFHWDETPNYEAVNLISVVTAKRFDQNIYKNVLLKIAKELNWEVILEHDDDGNEDVLIH